MPVTFKHAVRRTLGNPLWARPVSRALIGLGAYQFGYRVAFEGRCPPEVVEIPLDAPTFARKGLRMLSMKGRDGVARKAASRGWKAYEVPLGELFAACLNGETVVLDVGANTGFYSLLAAGFHPNIRVHAFEPVPEVAAILEQNLKLNGFPEGAVRLNRVAVGSTDGETELYIPQSHHGMVEMSASLNREFRGQHDAVLRVPVVSLDSYVASNRLRRVDVVKVDVETMEHVVLAGATAVLRRYRPVVFLEVLGPAHEVALQRLAAEADYVSVGLGLRALRVRDQVVADPDGTNQMLWPREAQHRLDAVALRLGLTASWQADGHRLAGASAA